MLTVLAGCLLEGFLPATCSLLLLTSSASGLVDRNNSHIQIEICYSKLRALVAAQSTRETERTAPRLLRAHRSMRNAHHSARTAPRAPLRAHRSAIPAPRAQLSAHSSARTAPLAQLRGCRPGPRLPARPVYLYLWCRLWMQSISAVEGTEIRQN